MSYQYITLETDDRGVATLTLNRADKHNALNADMCDEIKAAASAINQDMSDPRSGAAIKRQKLLRRWRFGLDATTI